jgi:GT2 family glycosyltransferase/glycosyltransferase involved in cell wall biosynthesis
MGGREENMIIDFYLYNIHEIIIWERIWRALRRLGVKAHFILEPPGINTAYGSLPDKNRGYLDCKDGDIWPLMMPEVYGGISSYLKKCGYPYKNLGHYQEAAAVVTTQGISWLHRYRGLKLRTMYGVGAGTDSWGHGKVNLGLDAIFVHGEFSRQEISKIVEPERIFVTGYPKFVPYFRGEIKEAEWREKFGLRPGRKTIAYFTTWAHKASIEKFFGVIKVLAQHYNILYKPHHNTLAFEKERLVRFREIPGIVVEENTFSSLPFYAVADLVLADVLSGTFTEALLADKPVIGLSAFDDPKQNNLIDEVNVASPICTAPEELLSLVPDLLIKDSYAEGRRRFASFLFASFEGRDDEVCAAKMGDFLRGKGLKTLSPTSRQNNVDEPQYLGRIILENESPCPAPIAEERLTSAKDEIEWFSLSSESMTADPLKEGEDDKLRANYGPITSSGGSDQKMTWQPKVIISVIIPTYNRSEVLLKCLESLAKQTYPAEFYEVLVCDDGSTNDTKTVVGNFAAPYRLIYLRQENRGPAAARNLGLRHAKGKYILILNDDTLADPDLLHKHLETHRRLSNQKIAVLGSFSFSPSLITSPIMSLLQNNTYWFAYPVMEPQKFYDFRYFWTCNISLPRRAFDEVGFFDEDFPEAAHEDVELGYRLAQKGYAVYYEPECRAEHYHMVNFYGFIRRSIVVGRNDVIVRRKHPNLANWLIHLKDINKMEKTICQWLKNHEPLVLGLMEVVLDLDSLGSRNPQLIEGLRHAMSRLVPMISQYWIYQGLLEGLGRYVYSRPKAPASLRLTFIVPHTSLFYGFKVVVEYANRLVQGGHRVTLVAQAGDLPQGCDLDPKVNFVVSPLEDDRLSQDVPEGEAVFATNWLTAYFVARLPFTKGEKFYLVQDYESTRVALAAQADPSYLLPLQKVVTSNSLAQLLKERFGLKAMVVPSGVNCTLFYPRPEDRKRYPGADLRIGIFYHPKAPKEMACALMAFQLIKRVHPNARLILMATSAPKEVLTADELYINLNEEDLAKCLNSLDLFLSSSPMEGIDLTALEALACGIPLVATDSGGVKDFAGHGNTALLCPPGDSRALANAALKLWADGDLRQRLIKQGLAVAREFNWESSVNGLVQTIQHTLNSRGKQQPILPVAQESRLKVGYLSMEPEHHLSPHLRLKAPLIYLEHQGHIEYFPLYWLDQGGITLNKANLFRADIIIVQNLVPLSLSFEQLRQILGGSFPRLVYDIDEAFTHLLPTHPEFLLIEKHKGVIEEYIRRADLVTVASAGLNSLYSHLNPNIKVLPDFLDTQLWPELPEKPKPSGLPVRILLYGPFRHAPERELVEEVIEALAKEFGDQVQFLFLGDPCPGLKRLRQVKAIRVFSLNYSKYAALIRRLKVDGVMVLLEDNSFNRGKSPLIWLESSACRVPGIYSKVGDYATGIESGETGLLVENTYDDWYGSLKMLITDAGLRRTLSNKAYEKVRSHHTLEKTAPLWLEAYQHLVSSSPSGSIENYIQTSIIIPVWNNLEYTRACLMSLYQHTATEVGKFEVIVVDNGSTDGTTDYLRQEEKKGRLRLLINPDNLGFAKACNQGAHVARGDYLVFLNNDTIVQPGWLTALTRQLEEKEDIGIVGGKLLYPNGSIQHAGVVFDERKKVGHIYRGFHRNHPAVNKIREFQAVTGACLIIRKPLFFAIGGFDEGYQNGFEDLDLCLRIRKLGYKIVYTPKCEIYHLEGQTPGRYDKDKDNSIYFTSKWHGQIISDKFNYYKEDGISFKLRKYDEKGNPLYIVHDQKVTKLRKEALLYKKQGLFSQSVEKYKMALSINPTDNRHLMIAAELADTYQMMRRDNEALKIYRSIINRSPLPHYQYRLAKLERRLGYLGEAVKNLEFAKATLIKGTLRNQTA